MASPHHVVDGVTVVIENAPVDSVAAAGSVWSSVREMSLWLRMLLRSGVAADGTRILSEAVVEEMFRPQALVDRAGFYPTQRLTNPKWVTYGLGWFQQDYDGEALDFHTGSIDGMVAIAGLIRDEGIGVYVLGNRDHVEVRHALMLRGLDALLGKPFRDWSVELKELYDGLAEEQAKAMEALRTRAGRGFEPRSRPGRLRRDLPARGGRRNRGPGRGGRSPPRIRPGSSGAADPLEPRDLPGRLGRPLARRAAGDLSSRPGREPRRPFARRDPVPPRTPVTPTRPSRSSRVAVRRVGQAPSRTFCRDASPVEYPTICGIPHESAREMEPNTSFWQRLPGANRPIVKKIAGAAFLFFLIKGLIWLGVAAAAAWAVLR